MKTSIVRSGWAFTLILLALSGVAQAQQEFRAGAYRGVMFVTTSVEEVGKTTASLKLKGRSTGNSTLKFIGVPQLAEPVLAEDDDFPVKLFRLEHVIPIGAMVFSEVVNVDAGGSTQFRVLDSLSVKGDSVRAELTYNRTLAQNDITFNVRIRSPVWENKGGEQYGHRTSYSAIKRVRSAGKRQRRWAWPTGACQLRGWRVEK
jgi:hypothetical protein